ncbi:nitroreductase family protein [Paenibacillus sp. 481]|uniref:nitroreductase family protein n=1 Tax=Paenibacillus sp. 481 TaxID=2835869 RepID=UPI001E3D0C99|nr:nitroreductase family protein [Paenibacillus sp. 481]UHA75514.1 nitroreductase family protein [Paenibacillus sp. 481]
MTTISESSIFSDIVKQRRSAMKFVPGVEISDGELEQLFSMVKYAPSAFNLQHTDYVVVRDADLKHKMYEAAYKQYKVQTASAVILVLGDKHAYRNVANLNEGMLHLGILSKQEYDATVSEVTGLYESQGDSFMRDEAIRNASLSAMLLMLVAKEQGWDTCPMIGFDPEAVREALQISDSYVPVMMITIGKEDASKQRPRGYRKPVGEFVHFDGFRGK